MSALCLFGPLLTQFTVRYMFLLCRLRAYSSFSVRVRCHLEDQGVDGKIILKWIFDEWVGGMDWIYLVRDRERWLAFVYTVMNFLVP